MNAIKNRFGTFRKLHLQLALILGLLVAMVATPLVSAQSTPTLPTPETLTRTITVSGVGTVSVEPDTADVIFAVQADDASLKEAQDDASTRLDAITAALTAGGVDAKDAVTSSYYVTVMNDYDENGNFVAISGYRVDAQITATVRDLDTLGDLLDSVVTAGANGIYGMTFYVDDPSGPASQARQAAMEDAKAKADELAAAAGVAIAGVVSIDETYAPSPVSTNYDMGMGGYGGGGVYAESAAKSVPVSPGSSDVTVMVQVVYEIIQPNG
jgi:uncharacterized protein YggE